MENKFSKNIKSFRIAHGTQNSWKAMQEKEIKTVI